MWVKVISNRSVPYVGKPGQVRKIGRSSAKALILLGKVVQVDDPATVKEKVAKVEVIKPMAAEADKPEADEPVEAEPSRINAKKPGKKASKKKASYKRRDLVAEQTKAVGNDG